MNHLIELLSMLQKEKEKPDPPPIVLKIFSALWILYLQPNNSYCFERSYLQLTGIDNEAIRKCFIHNKEQRDKAESLFEAYKASI